MPKSNEAAPPDAYDLMLYAALQLVEDHDAGRDTRYSRSYYERCRSQVDPRRLAYRAWLAAGADAPPPAE